MKQQDIESKIVLPSSPFYNEARQVFNRSIQKFPAAIAYCEDEKDVLEAVGLARRWVCGARVRSGGHNYEGFSVGNNAIVIDTSGLKHAAVDEESNTVTIGSGINNGGLYKLLAPYGYPFPSGTCPAVGASGLTLGGGWGHSARMFGLACDSLIEARMADARGRLLTANRNENPDLFWALRGAGGGNFGVVTSLKYELPPKTDNVTYVEIMYDGVTGGEAERFLAVWQEWLKTAGDRFTPNSRIFNSAEEGRGIFLRGFYYGTPEEAKEEVRPFLKLRGAEATFQYVTFYEATQIDASAYPPYELFGFGGRFAYGEFSRSEIGDIISLIQRRANGATYASIALYALGGRVRDAAPCCTAFFYRDADFIIGIETVWEDPEAKPSNLEWLYPRYKYLSSITCGSYVNFPYLGNVDYMREYYGKNAGRLVDVKRQYDPCNLFSFPQSIRPLAFY